MSGDEVKQIEIAALIAGYVRGLLALPLCADDAGLTREELIAKYRDLRDPGRPLEGVRDLAP